MSGELIDYAILGGLREDYCITHDERVRLGELGGNAAYAGAGAALWGQRVGLVSRVGSNYPSRWLEMLSKAGFDLQGVRILPEPQDTRTFYAYRSPEERMDTNPAYHFMRIEQQLPKELLDYRSSTEGQESTETFGPLAIRPEDLPAVVDQARAAHLAPADYLTHSLVPFHLRALGVSLISLDPSSKYMQPQFTKRLPGLIQDVDVFLPSEAEARAFFEPKPPDMWEMAEALASMGCRYVVIKRGASGQIAYDRDSNQRWQIPAYPARVQDVTGAGDAYCGGFLVGLEQTGDVVEACLRGGVSASIAIEGIGPLYCLDAAPGLPEARLEAMRQAARPV